MGETEINEAVKQRYSDEAAQCSNLSCGKNTDFVEILENKDFLELGCGRGLETIENARKMAECRFTGLDITEEMIREAEKNLGNEKLCNVEFVKGDIENLPFGNEMFDVVTSNCVINHAKDKSRAYGEIWRVLRNGGYFIISDPVTKYPLPEAVKSDPKEWADCFGGALTEAEYLETIKNSGFSRIEILKRREYLKKGYDFISLTIKAWR